MMNLVCYVIVCKHLFYTNLTLQIKWGGRWQDGSGAVTGEEMEQVNSYISTAGLTTKTMSKHGK